MNENVVNDVAQVDNGLATIADFDTPTHMEVHTDNQGRKFELRAIPPLDIGFRYNLKLHVDMVAADLDPTNMKDREDFLNDLSESELQALDYEAMNDTCNCVCKSVQNINFVNMKEKFCKRGQVSIYKLSTVDVSTMMAVIQRLTQEANPSFYKDDPTEADSTTSSEAE